MLLLHGLLLLGGLLLLLFDVLLDHHALADGHFEGEGDYQGVHFVKLGAGGAVDHAVAEDLHPLGEVVEEGLVDHPLVADCVESY